MSEMMNNKISEEQLNKVAGGNDGKWYRLWIYNPQGGECYGYIYKDYTELD